MNRFLDSATGVETHAWLVHIRMQDAEHAARLHRSIREIPPHLRPFAAGAVAQHRRTLAGTGGHLVT